MSIMNPPYDVVVFPFPYTAIPLRTDSRCISLNISIKRTKQLLHFFLSASPLYSVVLLKKTKRLSKKASTASSA